MRKTYIYIVFGVVLGMALIAATVLVRPYSLRGSQIDPPSTAPEIALTDGQGAPFVLSEQRGSLVLVFFGYTTCPDICPATLGEMKQVRQRLGDNADNVRFVFVTVDPQRDTADRIGKYAASFDPAFIGLTGAEEQLQPVWQAYGVYRAIQQSESAAGYLVDHSTRTYLIDREGNLRLTYAFGTPVEDLVQDLKYLMKH